MSAPNRGFWARIRRFWQSLTGSGVTTYSDDRLPGAHDTSALGEQGNAEVQMRNRMGLPGTP